MRIKRQNLQKLRGTYTSVCRLAGDVIEVINALSNLLIIGASKLLPIALDACWIRSPDYGTVEGNRDAGGFEIGNRNVVGFEHLGSNDLEVSHNVLDRTGDGVGAVSADGNLPLDVHHGVVAREALNDVSCKGRCLRLELVLISDCVHRLRRSPRGATYSQGERYAHQGGDDQVDVLHGGWLLICTADGLVVD